MKKLIDNKIIFNGAKGFVDKYGNIVGFSLTRHKRYIEDKYADIAMKI